MQDPAISVIVPVFNEAAGLPFFFRRVEDALAPFGGHYQLVYVDDGSTDESLSLLRSLAERDPRITVVSLSRNFGHQVALAAGLDHASGRSVAIIDADLQDPPELIPELHELLGRGYDVAYAVRRSRREGPLKRLAYWFFYRLLRALANHPIPLDSGDFCVMSARVAGLLRSLPEQEKFFRGLRAWTGFKHARLEYDRDPRFAGESKYTVFKLWRLAMDGILSASDRPLKLASLVGFVVSTGAFLFALYTVGWWFVASREFLGYASIAAGMFFLGGIQLVAIGILGEYIARIFNQVKGRPSYIVQETINSRRTG